MRMFLKTCLLSTVLFTCFSFVQAHDFNDDVCISDSAELADNIEYMIDVGVHFVTREDIHADCDNYIILDIGGEGYHHVHGITSGFEDAINLNVLTTDSQTDQPIPNLVELDNWVDPYPIADDFADYIVMQGAPLTDHNVDEIVRLLKRGGKVGLWINVDLFKDNIIDLATRLKAGVFFHAKDEFSGQAGFSKVLIVDHR